MLDAMEWVQLDANLIIYSDMSISGLGFTAPSKLIGFCTSVLNNSLTPTIFFYEALAITFAVLWVSGLEPHIKWVLIYTDSLNCVDVFNMLSTKEGYNNILLFIVCILMSSKISLCMFHIPGPNNIIADALS